jgi:hypothetical protein
MRLLLRLVAIVVALVVVLAATIFGASEFGGEVVNLRTDEASKDRGTYLRVVDDGANPQPKEQAVLNRQADALLGYFMDQGPRMQLQTGVKMGWTRLYDMAGVSTLSSAIIVNNAWLKEPKNQDLLRRFLGASQRGSSSSSGTDKDI